jgi:hypothetical protein
MLTIFPRLTACHSSAEALTAQRSCSANDCFMAEILGGEFGRSEAGEDGGETLSL